MKKNVVIIYGSKSTEHDISVLSALQIYNAIDKSRYSVDLIYIGHNGKWFLGDKLANIKSYLNFNKKGLKRVTILPGDDFLYLQKIGGFRRLKKVDCAVLSLHGKNGEDGTIQGLLELSNIPYTSSGVLGSAVSLDKITMKMLFKQNKISITDYCYLTKEEYENESFNIETITQKICFPVVVKPNSLGSSIGISIATNLEELFEGLKLAFLFDEKAIIEKKVDNLKEVNIAVLGSGKDCILSETEEVKNGSGILSFEKKYLNSNPTKKVKNDENFNKNIEIYEKNKEKTQKNCNFNEILQNSNIKEINNNGIKIGTLCKNGMQNLGRIIPANITETQKSQIEKMAKKIFEITNSKGVVRIDFMIDQKSKKVYANEINTIPGSFAFYLWNGLGLDFEKLADRLISIAIEEHNKKQKLISVFNSSVLGDNQPNGFKS